jgi:hypothetical protein
LSYRANPAVEVPTQRRVLLSIQSSGLGWP